MEVKRETKNTTEQSKKEARSTTKEMLVISGEEFTLRRTGETNYWKRWQGFNENSLSLSYYRYDASLRYVIQSHLTPKIFIQYSILSCLIGKICIHLLARRF